MLSDFDYDLPEAFIAQTPAEPRDSSRLMVFDKATGALEHRIFRDIVALIYPGDVLVVNTTRVIPARIRAVKQDTGGAVEILLLRQLDDHTWRALVGGRRLVAGTRLRIPDTDITATVTDELDEAERIVTFSVPINERLTQIGETPLPPYIHTPASDPERYQTVYSQQAGSAAAPTAGLHFTPALLDALVAKGVHMARSTLHIGLGTFMPVRVERITDHQIHSEWAQLSETDAAIINAAKANGGRIIAVGTTVARTLETAAILSAGGHTAHPAALGDRRGAHPVAAFAGDTNLFITPGYTWRAVDALITNFHLPKSTLLMMISSLVGRERLLHAYQVAKQEGYRFFSFGDAMFIA